MPRLGNARCLETSTHHRLVGHCARDFGADARQPEGVRDLRCRKNGAVAGDREHSFDAELSHRRDDVVDVREVDVDAHIRDLEADGVVIPVHGHGRDVRSAARSESPATARRLRRGREVSPRSLPDGTPAGGLPPVPFRSR